MGFGTKQSDIDTLIARLTSSRAGYMDNINQAGLLQLTAARAASIDDIYTYSLHGVTKRRNPVDLWIAPDSGQALTPQITIDTTPTLLDLGTFTFNDLWVPIDADIAKVILMLKFGNKQDDSGVDNYLDGAQYIRVKSTGDFITAINFAGGELAVTASSKENGDVIFGDRDLRLVMDADPSGWNSIDVSWYNATAFGDSMYLNDVQIGLRLYFYE
jgi:hypothetical protein